MNFTVLWLPKAESDLASVWLAADDRTAVTQAAYRIDAALGRDPEGEGESRADGYRIVFDRPLAAIFRVADDGRTVEVGRVWSTKRKK